MDVYRAGSTWGDDCVVGHQLGRQGDADGQGGEDHQRGDDAAARGGPLAAGGVVGHGGVVLALGIVIDFSPSMSVYFQVDRVMPTSGDKHCASGHGRRGGEGKLWESEDSLLFSHLPGNRALSAPQNRCDGSAGFRDDHDPYHIMAKGKWYGDVDDFTGVEGNDILVDDEI